MTFLHCEKHPHPFSLIALEVYYITNITSGSQRLKGFDIDNCTTLVTTCEFYKHY